LVYDSDSSINAGKEFQSRKSPMARSGCPNIGYFEGRMMRRTKGQQSGHKLLVNFSGVVFKYSKEEDQKLY